MVALILGLVGLFGWVELFDLRLENLIVENTNHVALLGFEICCDLLKMATTTHSIHDLVEFGIEKVVGSGFFLKIFL